MSILKKIKKIFKKKPIYERLMDRFIEIDLVKKVDDRYFFNKKIVKALSVLDEDNYKKIWDKFDLDNKLGKLIKEAAEHEGLNEEGIKKGILENIKIWADFNDIKKDKPEYIG